MVGTFEAVGFKFGRWLDSVLMQKALGKGAKRPRRSSELRHHAQRLVDRAQHAVELVAAAHDQAGGGDHAVGALAARQLRDFSMR